MKILVTGTAGFIGFHLAQKLLQRGDTVIGLDNINDYYDVNLKYARLNELGIDKNELEENKLISSKTFPNHKFVKTREDELIITKNNHMEIISKEQFERVQDIIKHSVKVNSNNEYDYSQIERTVGESIQIYKELKNIWFKGRSQNNKSQKHTKWRTKLPLNQVVLDGLFAVYYLLPQP